MATPKTYIYDNVIATYGDDFIKNFSITPDDFFDLYDELIKIFQQLYDVRINILILELMYYKLNT